MNCLTFSIGIAWCDENVDLLADCLFRIISPNKSVIIQGKIVPIPIVKHYTMRTYR
jgi:hypothetical protein